MDVPAWESMDGRFVGMFGFGSNNEKTLRARVKSPNLRYEGFAMSAAGLELHVQRCYQGVDCNP